MTPNISPEETKRQEEGLVDLLMDALVRLELEPRLIPSGKIEWLKGGFSCIELEARRGVDAAVLLLNAQYGTDHLYRVDYAVRGNIKGLLPNRIISRISLKTSGLIKKKIEKIMWEVPETELREDTSRFTFQAEIDGLPPGPGEVWEGGPHQKLTELLNQDDSLINSLRDVNEKRRGPFLLLSVVSDVREESIRIIGNLWIKPQDLLATYATPTYFGIVEKIGKHIKEVRKEFGGLAF